MGYHSTEGELAKRLAKLLSSDKYKVLVAQNENTLVLGWVVIEHRLTLEGGDRAEITGLVVSDSARGLGVGKQLVQSVLEWAKARQLDKVIVSSNVNRDGLHQFYKQIGFAERKTSKQYIKYL
ncbi:GNAT family N-acetyltransferase [Pseudoalteromonas luteoviolacea]|uniref:GNAT family N-acetyltransferase n=1 Tax=Pseudoalteromonas luteoviolacea TaxID=43657 RepID=UPI001153B816|nr:GNAT family N-acetyltransferase [Pseudoalteromonas luteoviolacea]TQF70681.1 GNAT family N-acetyltransferase [Pseudoalteromonas luteoviolacea]